MLYASAATCFLAVEQVCGERHAYMVYKIYDIQYTIAYSIWYIVYVYLSLYTYIYIYRVSADVPAPFDLTRGRVPNP